MKRKLLSNFGRMAAAALALLMMPLTALDVSANKALQELNCSGNQPTAFDASGCTAINETNFPDENFRAYLLAQNYGKDGILTDEEIENITEIDVHERGISSLMGINFFTALKYLFCFNNPLTELEVSANAELLSLFCSGNQLTELDVSANTELQLLLCSSNQLTSLDVSGCTSLQQLNCDKNQLTELDVSGCTELRELCCNNNQLTALDVSANSKLQILYCYNNQIRGEEMDGLIESLVDRSETLAGYFRVYYQAAEDESQDGNVCTKEQVAQAQAKKWTVQYAYRRPDNPERTNYAEYEGSDADDVASLRADGNADAPLYDLSGRRVQGKPAQKGIYVKDGMKILYK